MWARQATRPNAAAQWRALSVLGQQANASATADLALMAVLRESDQALLRERVAALAVFPAAIPELVRCAISDPAARVRRAAARSLAELELEASDQTRLRARLDVESSPAVKRALSMALGEEPPEGD